MDSQFAATHREGDSGSSMEGTNYQSRKRKKKRKRKLDLNVGEIAASNFHCKVVSSIGMAYDQLLSLAKKQGVFPEPTSKPKDNNSAARIAAKIEGPGTKLSDYCNRNRIQDGDKHGDDVKQDFLETMKDSGEECCLRVFLDDTYLLPPHSRYLLSDIRDVNQLVKMEDTYDLIVIDPPWENKSAKRLKSYSMLRDEDFLQLPVPLLAHEGSLIVVWVTNKQKEHLFVRNELFPKWNVEFQAQWIWLKVTRSGTPVYDLESQHKKTYEVILLGKIKRFAESGKETLEEPSATPNEISSEKVIISVPCSIHSRKPPLFEILKSYIPPSPKCLEMFARNLLPGWTSWGNEVLKYQHMDFFEDIKASA